MLRGCNGAEPLAQPRSDVLNERPTAHGLLACLLACDIAVVEYSDYHTQKNPCEVSLILKAFSSRESNTKRRLTLRPKYFDDEHLRDREEFAVDRAIRSLSQTESPASRIRQGTDDQPAAATAAKVALPSTISPPSARQDTDRGPRRSRSFVSAIRIRLTASRALSSSKRRAIMPRVGSIVTLRHGEKYAVGASARDSAALISRSGN